jgi:cytochrome c oxidase subunit II
MSIHPPPDNWFKGPEGAERLWIGMGFVWCMVLFLAMPFAHFKGKQNSTGESYRVEPTAFFQRVTQFAEANKVGEVNGIPIAQPAPGSDIYLMGQMWRWYPVLKLSQGQTYRLHVSALDIQHGLSLQPMNMNFQILPGYDHVLTITPTSSGEFSIICNEFCGIGHHLMTGRIIVE